jgi:hypothetical protein
MKFFVIHIGCSIIGAKAVQQFTDTLPLLEFGQPSNGGIELTFQSQSFVKILPFWEHIGSKFDVASYFSLNH